MLTLIGVQCVLWAVALSCTSILIDAKCVLNSFETTKHDAIVNGTKIWSFKRMPEEFVASTEAERAEHEIEHIVVSNDVSGFDMLLRLEPYFELAHRSIGVFNIINSWLLALYGIEGRSH